MPTRAASYFSYFHLAVFLREAKHVKHLPNEIHIQTITVNISCAIAFISIHLIMYVTVNLTWMKVASRKMNVRKLQPIFN